MSATSANEYELSRYSTKLFCKFCLVPEPNNSVNQVVSDPQLVETETQRSSSQHLRCPTSNYIFVCLVRMVVKDFSQSFIWKPIKLITN